MSEDNKEFGLVYPFVICKSNGGPYDDGAFVAGTYFGELAALTSSKTSVIEKTVPSPLIPQIDLLAMNDGYSLKVEPWDEHPEEWTFISMTLQEGT